MLSVMGRSFSPHSATVRLVHKWNVVVATDITVSLHTRLVGLAVLACDGITCAQVDRYRDKLDVATPSAREGLTVSRGRVTCGLGHISFMTNLWRNAHENRRWRQGLPCHAWRNKNTISCCMSEPVRSVRRYRSALQASGVHRPSMCAWTKNDKTEDLGTTGKINVLTQNHRKRHLEEGGEAQLRRAAPVPNTGRRRTTSGAAASLRTSPRSIIPHWLLAVLAWPANASRQHRGFNHMFRRFFYFRHT